jgi:hypothetical protein
VAFEEVDGRLRALLRSYAPPLYVVADDPKWFALDMAPEGERDPSTWFAGTRLGARYVSFYLMPVYVQPSLLDGITPELRRRMQGKSCFNFTRVDEALFAELADLTRAGFEATAGDPRWGAAKRGEPREVLRTPPPPLTSGSSAVDAVLDERRSGR